MNKTNDQTVNIGRLKELVEQTLQDHKAKAKTLDNPKGRRYILEADQAVLEVFIGEKWIGYDLTVDKSVTGKNIGTAEDTDNYPLDGEYVESSLEMFDSMIAVLEGLLSGKVYAVKVKGKPMLAVPAPNKRYKLIQRNNYFMGSKRVVDAKELPPELLKHPIKFN